MPRSSKGTTGRASSGGGIASQIDTSTWTKVPDNIQSIKFDDLAKRQFLQAYATNSLLSVAADFAGVAVRTVQAHAKIDPEFAEAMEEAKLRYRDRVIGVAQRLMLEGYDEPIVGGKNRDEIVAYKKNYATNLLAMEMKKVDDGYRDKQDLHVTGGGGGVLVVPGEQSVEDWIAEQQEANKDKVKPDSTKEL